MRRSSGGPPKCDDRVGLLHFSLDNDFLVEWVDGHRDPPNTSPSLIPDALQVAVTSRRALGSGCICATMPPE